MLLVKTRKSNYSRHISEFYQLLLVPREDGRSEKMHFTLKKSLKCTEYKSIVTVGISVYSLIVDRQRSRGNEELLKAPFSVPPVSYQRKLGD
jgi:hypothetical protein